MKHLKKFSYSYQYHRWRDGKDYIVPNVCLINGTLPIYNMDIPSEYEGEVDLPLYMEAIEDGFTVSFTEASGPIQYSLDNKTWNDLAVDTPSPSLNAGERIYLRAYDLQCTFEEENIIGWFETDKKYNLGGNIMSMLHGGDYKGKVELSGNRGLSGMFFETPVVSARNLALPATTLIRDAYCSLFGSCKYLEDAPMLPATTLAETCYRWMFAECTSLTIAPTLPATVLAEGCYNSMFAYCELLVLPPSLPATSLAKNCYYGMFTDCESLLVAPELPATTLAHGCYELMFEKCYDLMKAPKLPALTLAPRCYNSMFKDCEELEYVEMMATDISATDCMTDWMDNVYKTGTFVKNENATWDNEGIVPDGWKVETARQ